MVKKKHRENPHKHNHCKSTADGCKKVDINLIKADLRSAWFPLPQTSNPTREMKNAGFLNTGIVWLIN